VRLRADAIRVPSLLPARKYCLTGPLYGGLSLPLARNLALPLPLLAGEKAAGEHSNPVARTVNPMPLRDYPGIEVSYFAGGSLDQTSVCRKSLCRKSLCRKKENGPHLFPVSAFLVSR
jgi:hypothetical protein